MCGGKGGLDLLETEFKKKKKKSIRGFGLPRFYLTTGVYNTLNENLMSWEVFLNIFQHLIASTVYRQAEENPLCSPGSSSKHSGILLSRTGGWTSCGPAEVTDYTEYLKRMQKETDVQCLKIKRSFARMAFTSKVFGTCICDDLPFKEDSKG